MCASVIKIGFSGGISKSSIPKEIPACVACWNPTNFNDSTKLIVGFSPYVFKNQETNSFTCPLSKQLLKNTEVSSLTFINFLDPVEKRFWVDIETGRFGSLDIEFDLFIKLLTPVWKFFILLIKILFINIFEVKFKNF